MTATYSGLVYADDALRRSLNVPMIRLLQDCTIDAFLESALGAGLHSLAEQQDRLGLSLILGGCGVRLEELTAAYAALARRAASTDRPGCSGRA